MRVAQPRYKMKEFIIEKNATMTVMAQEAIIFF